MGKFTNSFGTNVPFKVVKETLQGLERNGELTTDSVLEEARQLSSPIHDLFDWDDQSAAEKYRREQARDLIQSVKVTIEDKRTNAYFSAEVSIKDEKPVRKYYSAQRVISDEQIRMEVLKVALREIHYWMEKYKTVAELGGVVDKAEVRRLEEQLAELTALRPSF